MTVPEFEIVSNPTVRIGEIKQRRFFIIDKYDSVAHIPDSVLSDLNMTREEAAEYFEGADDFEFHE